MRDAQTERSRLSMTATCAASIRPGEGYAGTVEGKIDPMRPIRPDQVLVLAVFAVGMTLYVYGYEHRADADYAREEGLDETFVLASATLLHVVLGAALRFKAVPALLLPIIVAIPAGNYPGGWPEVPVAMAMFFQEMFYGLPLVLLGIVIGWTFEQLVRRPTAA
jgi:hypothetical protein